MTLETTPEFMPAFKFSLREDLVNESNFIPRQATSKAVAWDVFAAPVDREPIVILPYNYFKIPLGFRCLIEPGWYFELHPRSSSLIKKHMQSLIGIIDEDYTHEVFFCGQFCPPKNTSDPLKIQFGESIAQIIPKQRMISKISVYNISNEEFDELCAKRNFNRTGGFGSTG